MLKSEVSAKKIEESAMKSKLDCKESNKTNKHESSKSKSAIKKA